MPDQIVGNEIDKRIKAVKFVEKSKSKAFLEILSSTDIIPSDELKNQYPDLLEKEKILRLALKEMQTRYLRNGIMMNTANLQTNNSKRDNSNVIISNSVPEVTPGELKQHQGELDQIYEKFEQIDKEYADLKSGRPLTTDNRIQ